MVKSDRMAEPAPGLAKLPIVSDLSDMAMAEQWGLSHGCHAGCAGLATLGRMRGNNWPAKLVSAGLVPHTRLEFSVNWADCGQD